MGSKQGIRQPIAGGVRPILRRQLNSLPKIVVGTVLVFFAICNLKDLIAPETALVNNYLNLAFKSNDCPPTLKPGHSFRLKQDKTLTAELWFPAYDDSVCNISVSALVPDGRRVSIEALRNSDLSQIPLPQARVDTVSERNRQYLRVSNEVPVAPNPKPANSPSAEAGSPPPPPGGPKILVNISNALTQRSYTKKSLYLGIIDQFKSFDHFTDIASFQESFGIMNLYFPLVFSLSGANFTYERSPGQDGEMIYFTPRRVASNIHGATTSLDVDFDDLIRSDKKDTIILLWGTILGAGVALLADGLANAIALIFTRSTE